MSDYIKREDALKALSRSFIVSGDLYGMGVQAGLKYARCKVEQIPAADVAEVVRCEGCKHSYTKNRPCDTALFRWCRKWDNIVRDCDFCSYGEYRTKTGDVTHE